MNETLPAELACPRCSSALDLSDGDIRCVLCDFGGAKREGIIDLRVQRHDYYFNPVSRALMRELAVASDPELWPATIRRFMREVDDNPDWLDNLVTHGRYAWQLFLQVREGGTLLDLGCGLGNLLHNLAPRFSVVFGLDLTWERLLFCQTRLRLFNPGARYFLVAGGDGRRLPFRDQSIDCVTISGVLEWIPDHLDFSTESHSKLGKAIRMLSSSFGETNPRREQLAFLREVRRILKQDGQIFVGIENRLNYEYFLGRNDHHSGLKYASLLPRLLANLYSVARSRAPYRTYTHTRWGYTRLFSEAGFREVEFLGLLDGYSKVKRIVPDRRTMGSWYRPGVTSVKDRIRRSVNTVPAFGILASSSPADPSIWDAIRKNLSKGTPDLLVTDILVTGKSKAVFLAQRGAESIVVKVPLDAASLEAEKNNWSFLARSHHRDARLPAPLAAGEVQHRHYFAERMLPGLPLSDLSSSDGARAALDSLAGLLEAIARARGGIHRERLSPALVRQLVDRPLEWVRRLADAEAERRLSSLRERILATLEDSRVPIGITHGDLSATNVLVDEGVVSGVIDWGYADDNGVPILDAIAPVESLIRLDRGIPQFQALALLRDGMPPHAAERRFLERLLSSFEVREDELGAYVQLYWLHHTSIRARESLQYEPRQIELHVNQALATVERF